MTHLLYKNTLIKFSQLKYKTKITFFQYTINIFKSCLLQLFNTHSILYLNINIWGNIIKDHKYSKAFQVLLYAYMYTKMNKLSFEDTKIESGIISFKNLKPGFMKVNKKPISQEDMLLFENELKHLLSQIFDINLPFIENENLPY